MLNGLKIAVLSGKQNIWFIRADKGKYAKHFRVGGLIAINHLEQAYDGSMPSVLPSEAELRAQLTSLEKFSKFSTNAEGKEVRSLNKPGFNIFNQVKRFCNEIKQGDLIVTRNERDDGYSFGICSSDIPYIEFEPVKIEKKQPDGSFVTDRVTLKFKLRKNVIWGPSISRAELPGAVRKATGGQQTVTSLNHHREKIYHLIYPFFTDGKTLFFSNKIRTSDRVNALAAGMLFQNLSLIESLTEVILSENTIEIEKLRAFVEMAILYNEKGVTCQAEFMSPGDVWCRIPLPKGDLNITVLACVFSCLIMTGQVKAEEIQKLSQSESITSVPEIKTVQSNMFEDKFQHAQVSPKLKAIAKAAEQQVTEQLAQLEGTKINETKDSLNLKLIKVETDRLENFDFGIEVLQIGSKNENP